jgi:hypothetical protein
MSKHMLDTLQSYIQQWHYSCLRLDKQQAVAARYEGIKQQQHQQVVVYLASTATAGSSSGISMTGVTRVIAEVAGIPIPIPFQTHFCVYLPKFIFIRPLSAVTRPIPI